MADDPIVKEGEVSEEGTPSLEETPGGEQPQLQFLTREQVLEILSEDRERIKQSSHDIAKAEIDEAQRRASASEGRAKSAENTLARVRGQYSNLDPEARQALEAEELRAQLGSYQSRDAEESQRQQMMATVNVFEGNLTQFITDMGLDPNDKRIDWGDRNSMNLTQRQDKVLKSVANIQKENAKVAEGKRSQEVKDVEARLRKELGLDSVDTSASPGAIDSDTVFIAKMVSGELELTEANNKRFNKLQGIT